MILYLRFQDPGAASDSTEIRRVPAKGDRTGLICDNSGADRIDNLAYLTDMPKGKVSVIIPAFNRGRYIRQTVESALGQTYTNIEVIVVDDGSSDDTRMILEQFGDRIKLLEHDGRQNRGQSASINLGLRKADGEYVAILDSDDYWEPDKIEIQVQYLEKNPDVGLIYCNGTAVNENGDYLYDIYRPGHTESNRPENVLLDCYFLVPNNSLIRMEILRQAGEFDEKLRAAQDHDMAIRIAEVTRIAYLDKCVFHYRRHEQSISKSRTGVLTRWNNGFIILDKAAGRYPYPASVIRRRKAVLHFRLFQCALENRAIMQALPHLLLAGLYDPVRACDVLLRRERISSPH